MHDSFTLVSLAKAVHASLLALLATLDHPKEVYCEDMLDVLVTSLCLTIRRHAGILHSRINCMNHLDKIHYSFVDSEAYDIAVLTRTIPCSILDKESLISFVYGLCNIASGIVVKVEQVDMEVIA